MVCFPVGLLLLFSKLRIEEFFPSLSLVKKTSDPKDLMLCNDWLACDVLTGPNSFDMS